MHRTEELVTNHLDGLEDVLVVGAGPSGLTLANSLYQQGVKCKIIDARPEIAKVDSKCTTTHSRVLEIFEQLGVLETISIEEYFVKGLVFYKPLGNKKWKPFISWKTDTLALEGVFWNHGLSIPQWKLETAMLSSLRKKGGDVAYNVKLLGLKQDEEKVLATLYDSKQEKEFKIRCKYLVGCDGVKSTVREQLQIQRIGVPYNDFFIIADVYVKNFNYALDRRYTFSGDKYHMHFAHLGDNLFRVFITYYEEFIEETHQQLWVGNCQEDLEGSKATLEWFQKQIDDLGLPFQLYNPIRFSSYQAFLGYVENSRKGRVYLAGDAAHSHTPHGGQGMNTGVMDSHNLGWKLAHTVLGMTKEKVLDTYVDEREPVWHQLVKRTDFIKNIAERKRVLIRFFIDYILPFLPKSLFLQKLGKKGVMLSLSYPNSPISRDDFAKNFIDYFSKGQRVYPGERAPDSYIQLILQEGTAIQTRLHNLIYGDRRLGDYTVLYFNRQDNSQSEYKVFKDLANQFKKRFNAKIAWCYVIPEGSPLFPVSLPVLLDIDNTTFKRYGVKNKAVYLIRPDGYVAYRNQPFEPEKLMKYFELLFTQ